jgi:hypothetical protein
MAQPHIHSIDAYTLYFAGILIDGGGGDGGWVEIELPQKFDSKSGVHGDVVTYKLGNNVATCKITLLQQAAVNSALFALHRIDTLTPTGAGVGDFILEDLNSGLEVSGRARIIQAPSFNIQAEAQEIVWTLHVFDAEVTYRPRLGI